MILKLKLKKKLKGRSFFLKNFPWERRVVKNKNEYDELLIYRDTYHEH